MCMCFDTELREHRTSVFNLNLNVNCAWGSAKSETYGPPSDAGVGVSVVVA